MTLVTHREDRSENPVTSPDDATTRLRSDRAAGTRPAESYPAFFHGVGFAMGPVGICRKT